MEKVYKLITSDLYDNNVIDAFGEQNMTKGNMCLPKGIHTCTDLEKPENIIGECLTLMGT